MLDTIDLQRATRARPCRFLLPDGDEVRVDPPSADQVRACLLLDPRPGTVETPLQQAGRIRSQAHILLGPQHAHLTGKLDPFQVAEVVSALYISVSGLDAEGYARWQLAARQNQQHLTTLEMIERLEDLTADVAAQIGNRLPSEIGAQPLADLVALRERLHRERQAEIKFQAALHDKTLR